MRARVRARIEGYRRGLSFCGLRGGRGVRVRVRVRVKVRVRVRATVG